MPITSQQQHPEIFEYEDATYLRTGECCRCGECCTGDPFDGSEGISVVPGTCPLYRIVEGRGHCSNRKHPYYLQGCVNFPEHPSQIADKPSCSYKFELISNGRNHISPS